jgi:hypothetical protein
MHGTGVRSVRPPLIPWRARLGGAHGSGPAVIGYPPETGAHRRPDELGDGMSGLVNWRAMAVMGSVTALFATAVAMAPGAAASSFRGCPNLTVVLALPTGEAGKTVKYHEHIKAISSQGVSCSGADSFIKKDLTTTTAGKVAGYSCKVTTTFKAPIGYVPMLCTRGGSAIRFARHGG